jgi:hypothetical protein
MLELYSTDGVESTFDRLKAKATVYVSRLANLIDTITPSINSFAAATEALLLTTKNTDSLVIGTTNASRGAANYPLLVQSIFALRVYYPISIPVWDSGGGHIINSVPPDSSKLKELVEYYFNGGTVPVGFDAAYVGRIINGTSTAIDSWDLTNVSDMSELFKDRTFSNSVTLSSWGTKLSGVKNTTDMFTNCDYDDVHDLKTWIILDAADINLENMFGTGFMGTATLVGLTVPTPLTTEFANV